MFGKLWSLCRFVGSVALYYVTPTPLDFELISATCEDEDITPDVISWLVSRTGMCPGSDRRVLIEYRYKGRGPYLTFDLIGGVVFPPENIGDNLDVDDCIVSAEVLPHNPAVTVPREEDVLKRVVSLAGPDGKWAGLIDRANGTLGTFPPELIYPEFTQGDSIVITFVNGDVIQ